MSPGYLLNYGSCRQRMRGTATAVSTGCYASVSTENYALAVSTENYALAVSAGNYAPTAGGLTTSTSTAFCRLVGLTVSSFPASERNDFELAIQATLVSATRRCT